MENNVYVSDATDSSRQNPKVHYRHYLDSHNNPVVICVQDFDYVDYEADRFLSESVWDDEVDAKYALKSRYYPSAKTRQEIIERLILLRDDFTTRDFEKQILNDMIDHVRKMD